MRRILLILAVLIEVSAAFVLARQAPAEAAAFVNRLAQAMSRRDREAVGDMVQYPFAATVSGIGMPIANRAQLISLYDGLFTAELRCLVEASAADGPATCPSSARRTRTVALRPANRSMRASSTSRRRAETM